MTDQGQEDYKTYTVKGTRLVAVEAEVDAASPEHALSLARKGSWTSWSELDHIEWRFETAEEIHD